MSGAWEGISKLSRGPVKKKGCRDHSKNSELIKFNEFISVMDLFDLLAFESKFMWFNTTGASITGLNGFLIF